MHCGNNTVTLLNEQYIMLFNFVSKFILKKISKVFNNLPVKLNIQNKNALWK